MNLKGKKVVVTGAAVRIGRKICEAFAMEGAHLVIHFNSSEEEAHKLLEELGGAEKGHAVFKCDLSNPAELEKMSEICFPADILVNNASVYRPVSILEENYEGIFRNLQVNFLAPLGLMKEFCRKNPGNAQIINILDERISRTLPDEGSYELSKKSLLWATKVFALQAAPSVRVNAVAPGATLPPSFAPEFAMIEQLKRIPMKKVPLVEDISDACVFLARNESMTGQIIYVDGGQHLNG